jgi:uncharacterized membrane protein
MAEWSACCSSGLGVPTAINAGRESARCFAGSFDTAVMWRGGHAIDLGRYPGGTVSRAFGVNDQGKVVGEGNLVPDGPMRALRWTIKPGQAAVVEWP